jgi:hypothetical protein
MRILLVNGSPRRAAGNSRLVLDAIRSRLGEGHEYRMAEAASGGAERSDLDTDFIVLAFPLYIDCLHSRLLAWLLSYEELLSAARSAGAAAGRIGMIAVANNGFHEGEQNETALRIVENFCARAGIEWRGGLGIGTGEMLRALAGAPDGMFLKRPVSRAIDAAASLVGAVPATAAPARAANRYASHAFPWILFKAVAHAEWRRAARANGLGRRDLKARPFPTS